MNECFIMTRLYEKHRRIFFLVIFDFLHVRRTHSRGVLISSKLNCILRHYKAFEYFWSCELFTVAKNTRRPLNHTKQNVKKPVAHVKVEGV